MFHIRPATVQDSAALARVQVDSYRNAYAGMFPDSYLSRLSYSEQERDWRDLLAATDDILLVAISSTNQVVGYVLARAQQDIHPGYDAEILGVHVDLAQQHHGIGASLLKGAVLELQRRGAKSMVLWTLQGSPARRWYERLGGQVIGEKTYPVDGRDMTEIIYAWPDLRTLLR